MNEPEGLKIAKICNEILAFFLSEFGNACTLTISPEPERHRLTFEFAGLVLTAAMFDDLERRLVVDRQPELEDYYWQLMGETAGSNQFMLVGMMCDEITIHQTANALQITVIRLRHGR